MITLFQGFPWRGGEQPHALVGAGIGPRDEERQGGAKAESEIHPYIVGEVAEPELYVNDAGRV